MLKTQPIHLEPAAHSQAEACASCTRRHLALCGAPGDRQMALMRELMRRWRQALDDAVAWISELCARPAQRRVIALLQRGADECGHIGRPRRDQMEIGINLAPGQRQPPLPEAGARVSGASAPGRSRR